MCCNFSQIEIFFGILLGKCLHFLHYVTVSHLPASLLAVDSNANVLETVAYTTSHVKRKRSLHLWLNGQDLSCIVGKGYVPGLDRKRRRRKKDGICFCRINSIRSFFNPPSRVVGVQSDFIKSWSQQIRNCLLQYVPLLEERKASSVL